MKNLYYKFNENRGEVSLLYVFVVLSMVIVSSFTISIITINSIKGANVSESSAYAQTAVDSFLEKATYNFNWSEDTDTVDKRCTRGPGDGIYTEDPWRDGTKVTVIVDDGTTGGDPLHIGGCPSKEAVTDKTASLCIYVFAENNGVLKKKMAGAGKEWDSGTNSGGCPLR